jgi:hypothetical protein
MQDANLATLAQQLEEHIKNNQQELVRQMGFEFLGKGQRAQAASCFNLLKNSNIGDIQARTMYVQATLTHDQPSYAAARDEFLSILRDFPSLVTDPSEFACTIVRNAAHTCIWTNDFEKARELLEALVKTSVAATDYKMLKEVYEHFGDMKGELWALQEMVRLDKNNYGNSETIKKISALQKYLSSEEKTKKITIQRYPTRENLKENLEKVIADHVVQRDISDNALPKGEEPFVCVMGGCWHRDFGLGLKAAGVKHHFLPIADQVNTPASNLGFVEWLCDPDNHYFKNHAAEYIPESETAASIRDKFAESNIIILTYTKAFELMDIENDRVAFDGISIFTLKALTAKYQFRLASLDDCVRSIVSTIRLLRTINSTAKIVLQISPSPLFASVGDESTVCNDFLSKAMLKIAINEVINKWKLEKVTYWPSIEIFRWVASHQTDYFGGDDGSAWHVSLESTEAMVKALVNCHTTK